MSTITAASVRTQPAAAGGDATRDTLIHGINGKFLKVLLEESERGTDAADESTA